MTLKRFSVMTVAVSALMTLACALACALPASAQEIVDAAPSNTQAVAAGDVATVAVAQLNDKADAAQAQEKVELYKQLMELNGMSRNIRLVLNNTKTTTKLIVIQRAGATAMTADQDARYNTIADGILKDTENSLINDIASAQSQSFSSDEIQQLIVANSSIAAAKYNAGKFQAPDSTAQEIQGYMVEAVIKIIKSFTESVAS